MLDDNIDVKISKPLRQDLDFVTQSENTQRPLIGEKAVIKIDTLNVNSVAKAFIFVSRARYYHLLKEFVNHGVSRIVDHFKFNRESAQ